MKKLICFTLFIYFYFFKDNNRSRWLIPLYGNNNPSLDVFLWISQCSDSSLLHQRTCFYYLPCIQTFLQWHSQGCFCLHDIIQIHSYDPTRMWFIVVIFFLCSISRCKDLTHLGQLGFYLANNWILCRH